MNEISSPPPSNDQINDILPNGWSKEVDEYGQVYYYNSTTGESSWEPPVQMNQKHHGPWVQHTDSNGREYWVHNITGRSVWELPSLNDEDD